MRLYLSSYRLGNRVDVIEEWLKNHDNKIILITNARDESINSVIEKEKLEEFTTMLENVGFKVEYLDLKKYFNKEEELVNKIKDYSSFCVTGGNVFALRKAMNLSGFDNYILNNIDKDILYVCWSAGGCILSKSLRGYETVDPIINPYNDEEVMFDGLGILDKMFVPHYKSDHVESHLVDDTIKYLEENNIEYVPVHDGDVIIKDI